VARIEVQIGQKYRAAGTNFLGSPRSLWTVDGVFTSTDALRYARLTNVLDPTLRKTLALDVLMDRQRYVLEPAPVA
jgi:hypothetical protein